MNKAEAPVIDVPSKSFVKTAHGIAADMLFSKICKSRTQLLEGAILCLLRI